MYESVAVLRERYPQIAPQLLQPFFELLIAARTCCGGDMEAFVILLSVALPMIEHEQFGRLSTDEIEGTLRIGPIGPGTNARSIADSTGIPRETVRRKVETLEAQGLIARHQRRLYCRPAVFHAFTPVRETLLRAALKTHRAVDQGLAGR